MPWNPNKHVRPSTVIASISLIGAAAAVYVVNEEFGQPNLRHAPTSTHAPQTPDSEPVHLLKFENHDQGTKQAAAVRVAEEIAHDMQVAEAAGYGKPNGSVVVPALGRNGMKETVSMEAFVGVHRVGVDQLSEATLVDISEERGKSSVSLKAGRIVQISLDPTGYGTGTVTAEIMRHKGTNIHIISMAGPFGNMPSPDPSFIVNPRLALSEAQNVTAEIEVAMHRADPKLQLTQE